jgi:hypothetical protein
MISELLFIILIFELGNGGIEFIMGLWGGKLREGMGMGVDRD